MPHEAAATSPSVVHVDAGELVIGIHLLESIDLLVAKNQVAIALLRLDGLGSRNAFPNFFGKGRRVAFQESSLGLLPHKGKHGDRRDRLLVLPGHGIFEMRPESGE